jgi:arylsulfatase A-like enzyme/Tfp pilus assembly protein PilF
MAVPLRVRAALLGAVLAVFAPAACHRTDRVTLPQGSNVLLITVDTLRGDALGWIGGRNETPALDLLAANGVRFPQTVSPAPLTLPAHASMLTGLEPGSHGVRDNGQVLDPQVPLLTEQLRESGYRTAAFVSGFPLRAMFGLDRGFDHYDDRLPGAERDWLERPAAETTRAALSWIESQSEPWFVWVHYYDPHAPYEPPAEFARTGPRGAYEGEVAYVDSAIEALLSGIPDADRQRTLTVFTADHGEAFGEHDELDHGLFLYDVTMVVPLGIHYPGVLSPADVGVPVRLVDLTPTVIELLSLTARADWDGTSLAPALAGLPVESDHACLETRYPWITYGWAPLTALRTREWKLIDAPRRELYRLDEDPEELRDLAPERPEVVALLTQRLESCPREPDYHSESVLDADTRARLESLGYVGGSGASAPTTTNLADPKDRVRERNLLLAADAQWRADRLAEALATFDEVLIEDPGNRFAVLRSGLLLADAGRLAEAIPRLERAVELAPSQPEAHYALAEALTRSAAFAEAVPHWQETVRLQPRRVAAWSNLGSTLGWSGRLEEAAEAFSRAVQLEPDNPRLLINLGSAQHALGRATEAADSLLRAEAAEGESFPVPGLLGLVLARVGRGDEAIERLRHSQRSESSFAEARFQLAILELERGRVDEARQALSQALEASPQLEQLLPSVPGLADLR